MNLDKTRASTDRHAVSMLEEQASTLRAELFTLRKAVDQARRELSDLSDNRLVEANERLVVAALHADSLAESATLNLNESTLSSQLDPLTNAPNRLLMLDRLGSAITMAHRRGTRLAVLFVDLDHFKRINDTFGHAIGDQVLQFVVRRLQSVTRASDTVSRYGGDEFLVLLPEIAHVSDAATTAGKMLASLGEPSRFGAELLQVTASIGIATYPDDGDDPVTLIAKADKAMYRAKEQGGGAFDFHRSAQRART